MLENISFLATCVGAYGDSGLGTGGFFLWHRGEGVVIDNLDSTGLVFTKGLCYRFIRALQTLVIYDASGVRSTVRLSEAKDVHDIYVTEKEVIVVSTGTNEVHWYDWRGEIIRKWSPGGNGDAWHLNCLYGVDTEIYISAFGKFDNHRDWNGNCRDTGFVMKMHTEELIIEGLSGPHNPRKIHNRWLICDSHKRGIRIIENGENNFVNLGGFTRGIAVTSKGWLVGVSADRKSALENPTGKIKLVESERCEIMEEVSVPFPEIYDIVEITPEFGSAIISDPSKYLISLSDKEKANLKNQVNLGLEEIYRQNAIIDHLKKKNAYLAKKKSKDSLFKKVFHRIKSRLG
ncbi:protein of unknown function [Catalinimonas alkaloidigena]|uniref:Conserved hypothetical protein CHP03032 domain-containing protein n=1 Tax=Catalinimonas alkaloidigena TaxID=1075417 RepID=A0A1G9LGB5_9BACT|nr:DUF4915 domain-containing protein [Catalinimonas alkaloidigena]SDL61022.1 protein of unknown function [Catalinimonas alkaloidigena]